MNYLPQSSAYLAQTGTVNSDGSIQPGTGTLDTSTQYFRPSTQGVEGGNIHTGSSTRPTRIENIASSLDFQITVLRLHRSRNTVVNRRWAHPSDEPSGAG